MTRVFIAAAALAMLGCARAPINVPPPPPTAGTVETIRYQSGPCPGVCPVYIVTVSSDGRGLFEGIQHTALLGKQAFQVTPAQYRQFRDRLAPYRLGVPQAREAEDPWCDGLPKSDAPALDIVWSGKGPQERRRAHMCDVARNLPYFAAWRHAPTALPIARFIGRR